MSARVSWRRAFGCAVFIGSSSFAVGAGPDAVGARDQLDRVHRAGRQGLALRQQLHSLPYMHAGERAFRGEMRLGIAQSLARDRLPDLERGREILFHDAPRAAMARAALDD